jgi:hypothetical protein
VTTSSGKTESFSEISISTRGTAIHPAHVSIQYELRNLLIQDRNDFSMVIDSLVARAYLVRLHLDSTFRQFNRQHNVFAELTINATSRRTFVGLFLRVFSASSCSTTLY